MTSVIGGVTTTYTYDGDGKRVGKTTGASATVYVYDAAGSLAAEYSTAPAAAPCTTCYLTADTLGSTRMITDGSGNVKSLHDYLPFGEEITSGVAARTSPLYPAGSLSINDGTTQKFTGKERDVETGNDYFGARYLSAAQMRWTIPDWSARQDPVPYAKLADPQTLNLYAYLHNNPLGGTDPDGHQQPAEHRLGCGETQADCYDGPQPQSQPQQKAYDQSKSGPEDPTHPGHQLSKNKEVRKQAARALARTNNGQARDGLAEAGFRIDKINGKLVLGDILDNVHDTGPATEIHIPITNSTIAIMHSHGVRGVPTPSALDRASRVPNFVRTPTMLYVTVPGTDTFIQLEPAPK